MTLSQGIIKKWLLVFVLCFSMVFAFFPQSKAEAASSGIEFWGTDKKCTRLISASRNGQNIVATGTNFSFPDLHFAIYNDRNKLVSSIQTLYSSGNTKTIYLKGEAGGKYKACMSGFFSYGHGYVSIHN